MKIFLKFVKWASITLAVLLALFIGINAFDEKLDPDAAAILNAQSNVKADENAYFYWAGMYTQIKIAGSGTLLISPNSAPECHEQNELKPLNGKLMACEWRKTPCLQQYFEQRATIKNLSAQNQIMLERYERLLEFKKFDDIHPFPQLYVFLKASPAILFSAISATRLQDGDSSAFIRRTRAETNFYRMILSGEASLIPKMIGIAWLERSARLVSDAVRANPSLAQQDQAALLEITQPLNAAERSLGKTIEGEFRFSVAFMRSIPSNKFSFLERVTYPFIYKQNATENYYFRDMSVLRNLSQLPTEQYLSAEKFALERLNSLGDGYLHLVYNPMGKILAGSGIASYASYPRRIIDADGLLRLVSLQIQIAAQKIPEPEIPDFLKRAGPQLRNPYTGQAMQWDRARGLYFHGYSERITDKEGFVSVKL
jgi:hypothetical protein